MIETTAPPIRIGTLTTLVKKQPCNVMAITLMEIIRNIMIYELLIVIGHNHISLIAIVLTYSELPGGCWVMGLVEEELAIIR